MGEERSLIAIMIFAHYLRQCGTTLSRRELLEQEGALEVFCLKRIVLPSRQNTTNAPCHASEGGSESAKIGRGSV